MPAMSLLPDLPTDVLVVIAKKLKKLEDFLSFGSVSKSLFAAAKDEYFEGIRLRQQTTYFMLPVRDDGDDDVRELYSLIDGESIVASVKSPNLKSKKCLESLGWLLAVAEDGNMSLFDPFSDSAEIPLPHQTTFPMDHNLKNARMYIRKMVLSARPSETSDFILMVIASGENKLTYWCPGDQTWNKMKLPKGAFADVVYHGNGRFYAIVNPGVVWVFDLSRKNNKRIKSRIVTHFMPKDLIPGFEKEGFTLLFHNGLVDGKRLYVLKADNTLFIITRRPIVFFGDDESSRMTNNFWVYEVNVALKSWKEIYSLGNMAVFLGHNSTMAVDASRFPGGVIKANHIYFTDDNWQHYYFRSEKGGGVDTGVYNMETGKVELVYPWEPLRNKISTSLWITPCL